MALTPIPPIASIMPNSISVEPAASSGQGPAGVGASFGQLIDNAMAVESGANELAVKMATGELTDIHQFTTAAAQAQLTVELAAAVRNRAVDAFNEVMRMQI